MTTRLQGSGSSRTGRLHGAPPPGHTLLRALPSNTDIAILLPEEADRLPRPDRPPPPLLPAPHTASPAPSPLGPATSASDASGPRVHLGSASRDPHGSSTPADTPPLLPSCGDREGLRAHLQGVVSRRTAHFKLKEPEKITEAGRSP